MRSESELTVEKTVRASHRIFWSFIGFFFLAGVISALVEAYDLKWLEVIGILFFATSMLLLVISWGMPGIFILLGVPWLARAWFRGLQQFSFLRWYSSTPWKELSVGEKVSTYLHSMLGFAILIMFIVAIIWYNFQP